MEIRLKRAYDEPDHNDGYRILVDRIWPRGVTKKDARLDEWLKNIAPSTKLRKWFNHDPEKWEQFLERYFRELDEQKEAIDKLITLATNGRLTLVYSARDRDRNNAVALKIYLMKKLNGPMRGRGMGL